MAGNNMNIDAQLNLQLNVGAESAKKQLADLQKTLKQVSNIQLNVGQETLTQEVREASQAALELSTHLTNATNIKTGNLDFTKFTHSLSASGKSVEDYTNALMNLGNQGKTSFVNLANSIAASEIPLKRTSKLLDSTWDNLKKTIGWQFSSSLVHGFIGSIQQAVGYAQDLNKSLTDIRIVTGASTDSMAQFAKQANDAAKRLSTTTTDYTKASLIYYQQGLSDSEVKARTETTIKMANATGTSAQKVSDQMTAIWNNYDNGTKSLTHYADVMTKLGAATASSTDEIAQGLQKFASISETVGLSYEYAASALATVTATSRESADVVGNSFKTLFSRIQGLQLGETLEDGTDLNKYSTALAKVGISIKDSSGELKNMDTILDEMGSKWETLGRDQQMALAQTVAGVRQYTQLMTLMENWDFFQQNLKTANTAGGTLDQQAAIYAESWEAASNRVRASWEGLWDSFINSDSFISALDGLSTIINSMDDLVSGLGGGGSALAAFGGILGKVFKPQLTKSIADTAYNLQMMMPGAQDKIIQQRQNIMGSILNSVAAGGMGLGDHESTILKDNLSMQMLHSAERMEKRRNMSDQEILLSENIETQLLEIRNRKMALGQQMDLAENNLDLIASGNKQLLFDKGYESKERAAAKAERDKVHNEKQKTTAEGIAASQKYKQDIANLWDKDIVGQNFDTLIKQAATQGAEFAEQFKKSLWDNTDKGLKKDVLDYDAIQSSMESFAEKGLLDGNLITKLFDKIGQEGGKLKGDSSDADRRAIRMMAEEVSQSGFKRLIDGMDLTDEEKTTLQNYAKQQYGFITSERDLGVLNTNDDDLRHLYNTLGQKKTDKIGATIEGADAVMFTVSAIESLKALTEEGQSFSERLISLVSLMSSGAMAAQGFANALEGFGLATKAVSGLNAALGGLGIAANLSVAGVGALIVALAGIATVVAGGISRVYNNDKIVAEQAQTTSANLIEANNNAQIYHTRLVEQVETYQQLDKELNNLTLSEDERIAKTKEANNYATSIISNNNLQEGTDYQRIGNEIKINEASLNKAVENAKNVITDTEAASMIGENAAWEAQNKSNQTDLVRSITAGKYGSLSGDFVELVGGALMAIVGGMGMTAAGVGTVGSAGTLAAPGAALMYGSGLMASGGLTLAGKGFYDLNARTIANNELDLGIKYLQEHGSGILNEDIDTIASQMLGVSRSTIQLMKINASSLQNLNAQYDAQIAAEKLVAENAALNILNQEDILKKSEYATELADASGRLWQNEYNNAKETINQFNARTKADEYATQLGLSSKTGFRINTVDSKNKEVNYSYYEDGNLINKAFTFDQIASGLASSDANNAIIEAVGRLEDNLKLVDETKSSYDSAVKSFLISQDYTKATINNFGKITSQLQSSYDAYKKDFMHNGLSDAGRKRASAKDILRTSGLDVDNQDILKQIAEDAGYKNVNAYLEDFYNKAFAQESTLTSLKNKLGTQMGSYNELLNSSSSPFGNLTVGDAQNLYNILGNLNSQGLGTINSESYIAQLQTLLGTIKGIDQSEALSEILKLDPTTPGYAEAIIAVIESLGGVFTDAGAAARDFANAMAGITLPDFASLVNQLEQVKSLLGDMFKLDTGSNISDELYNQIIEAFPELKDFFTPNAITGGWDYLGDSTRARNAAKSAYFETGAELEQRKSWSDNMNDYMRDTNGELVDIDEWSERQANALNRYNQESAQAGSQTSAGYSGTNILNAIAQGAFGQGAIDAILGAGFEGIESAQDFAGLEQQYIEMAQAREAILAEYSDINGDGIVDSSDITDEDKKQEYDNYTAEMENLSGLINNIMSFLSEIAGIDWDSKIAEHEAEKGSVAETTDELGNMYGVKRITDSNGNVMLSDENGNTLGASESLQDYVTQLARMGEQYDYSRDSALALSEAIADGNWVLADSLAQQVEMETAIAQTAEARKLDAETVAFYAEQIQSTMSEEERKTMGSSAIADMAADMAEQQQAVTDLNKAWKTLSKTLSQDELTLDKGKALKELGKYLDGLTNSTTFANKSFETLNKGYSKFIKEGGDMSKVLKGNRKEITKLARCMSEITEDQFDWAESQRDSSKELSEGSKVADTYQGALDIIDSGIAELKSDYDGGFLTADDLTGGQATLDSVKQAWMDIYNSCRAGGMSVADAMAETAAQTGLEGYVTAGEASDPDPNVSPDGTVTDVIWTCTPCDDGEKISHTSEIVTKTVPGSVETSPSIDNLELVPKGDAPAGTPTGGGGGGGGGKPKEPKKVANKRKSQTVKRYKQNDFKRKHAERATKSEQNKTDYLYGERKIAQLEKINQLTQKEARITADRIKESREYLVEDRKNLIKYMEKYGFEAEFDADGFLSNYEKVWNEIYEEIAALYEDNELTEEESDLEEELNIKLEELEGALEDYENSLEELAEDIEKYEESLFEIYDNKIEALEHKVEFKIELEEDDLEYLDFWIESLGDSVYNAIESIEAMGAKANMLFNGLDVYKQGVQDIYDLSDDPLQVWATGGLAEVLTQDQIDALRENRDGLMDYMQQLIDLREEIKDKVLDTFDSWQEKIDATAASLEHYTSVIEHFKNIIDIVGKDPFGLSDEFMNRLEQNAINQSMDNIEANKAYYESLIEQQQKAEEELANARQRGDESSIEHWEEVVRTTTEAAQSAQDTLLTSLEDTLTMIAEQFETAMQRAVDAFNDAIYSYGGMEGLANDYNLIRENADLMAADYEKIYELSKLTRDINKVLDDTNIVAGKKKMNGLLKEINALQADGVELSKYDLEYLRAKYELRLAEIELENAQNSKDTVRLSKDSEGNWSYVYTQNADAVEEAEQKYEDALYEMQNLSQEYLEEMSSMMLDTSQSMMEEISALRIQDFTSYEAYQAEIKHIQDKYAESLRHQENELNKAVQNSSDLYKQDWQTYNQITGYKISLTENWVDSFKETTLGDIMDIDTFMSGFSDTFLGLTDEMSAQLANAAIQYFKNVDSAMNTYGTSIEQFGQMTTVTIDNIQKKSQSATEDMKIMAEEMSDAFKEIADYVSNWQEEFSGQIDTMLEEIKELVQSINEAISKSAELAGEKGGAGELIGSAEAIELLNATGQFGSWSSDGSVGLKVDGKSTNFVDYNAALIEEIDDAVARYANAKTGTEEREKLGEELKELFKRYWQFRDIVSRVYDPTNLTTNMEAPSFTSFDTGGYTGEWGKEGRMAMLHEKELILNSHDTSNFLDALNISRDIIHSMIEMNARASSLGFGNLSPSTIPEWDQTFEQTVTITAEFPDATNHNEIEEAFNNLLNTASQYANRNL